MWNVFSLQEDFFGQRKVSVNVFVFTFYWIELLFSEETDWAGQWKTVLEIFFNRILTRRECNMTILSCSIVEFAYDMQHVAMVTLHEIEYASLLKKNIFKDYF